MITKKSLALQINCFLFKRTTQHGQAQATLFQMTTKGKDEFGNKPAM